MHSEVAGLALAPELPQPALSELRVEDEPPSTRARRTADDAETGTRNAGRTLRDVVRNPTSAQTGVAQLLVTVAILLPAWASLGAVALAIHPSNAAALASSKDLTILATLAGELAIGAAALSVMRAWATREIAPALAGVGFLVYGLRTLVQMSSLTAEQPASTGQQVGSSCLVVAFGLLLLSIVHRRGRRRSQHPLTFWVCTLIVALVALIIIRPNGSQVLSDGNAASTAGNLVVAITWATLGAGAIYIGRAERAQLKIWIGFTALCLAQARMANLAFADPSLRLLAGSVLQTTAVGITLLGTVRALQETINHNHGLLQQSLLAFKGSEDRRREEADAHNEAIHNLRSALTSIGTATHLLVADGPAPLREDQRSQVLGALEAELDRARRLLSREWDRGCQPFDLLDVIGPVVVNECGHGTQVSVDVPYHTIVVGNPERTYEVFATLFENARRHAPGSPVDVRWMNEGSHVTVAVEDRGPGLPSSCMERIFERGWSTSSPGEGMGLGLFLARRLMEEQGGQLLAHHRPGGGASFRVQFQAQGARTPHLAG